MGNLTKLTMDEWLPEVWSAVASVTYRSNTILSPLLDHKWEPELGVGMGDQVNIPTFTQNQRTDTVTRGTFGTGAALTFTGVTDTPINLVVNQMVYHAWRMPVEMSVQSMAAYQMLLNEGVPQSLALQMDYFIASDSSNGFEVFTAIGTDNVDVTDAVILQGETNLNAQNAPLNDRVFVMSPATRASLMSIDVIRNQLYSGSVGNLAGDKGAGFLGKIYTLDCYMSNNLLAGTSGKKNAIFQKEAIALCEQQSVRFEKGINIADGLFNEYVGYIVYGMKLIKTIFGREVDGK